MNWLPSFEGLLVATAVLLLLVRMVRIRRRYNRHRIARFLGLRFDAEGRPDRYYWKESVTRLEVEDALHGRTDHRWGWLYRRRVRRTVAVANPVSWAMVLYGASDLPGNLGFGDSALSYWALLPIPLWLLARRAVRLVADAPDELLDERLVALRNRTYVSSYRGLATIVSVFAAVIIPVNDLGIDHSLDFLESQRQLIVAAAYTLIWATAALPSVVLAWSDPDWHRE